MNTGAKILVVTDEAGDGTVISSMLCEEYENVNVLNDPDKLVEAFDAIQPNVLVLAFEELRKSERRYLSLCKQSSRVYEYSHRVVVFCSKDTVKEVYELCQQEVFDDYVVFWPLSYDTTRPLMAVKNALIGLATVGAQGKYLASMAAQAERIVAHGAVCEDELSGGTEKLNRLGESVSTAQADVSRAIDKLSGRILRGELSSSLSVKDSQSFRSEIDQFKAREVAPSFGNLSEEVGVAARWAEGLKQQVLPQIEAARSMKRISEGVRPVVYFVDDDTYQLKLFSQFLYGERVELIVATSGERTLRAFQKRHPNLVFVDVHMPGMDGYEVVRRIRANEALRGVPVVMVTGKSERRVVESSLRAGANDFLVKPFNKDTLIQKVKRHLYSDVTSTI